MWTCDFLWEFIACIELLNMAKGKQKAWALCHCIPIFKCTLIILLGRAFQSFTSQQSDPGVQIMLRSVNLRTACNQKHTLSFLAGESLSRERLKWKEGPLLIIIHFAFFPLEAVAVHQTRQTLTWVTSHCFYPHFPPSCYPALIQDNWAAQQILLKHVLVSLDWWMLLNMERVVFF